MYIGVYCVGKLVNFVLFCFILDLFEYGLLVIWVYLEFVLKSIKKNLNIDIIYFFSDGFFS